jgi:hypothetical protein
MGNRITTLLLLVGIAFTGIALVPKLRAVHLPGNHQGFEPVQPIAYSHRLHAGELAIDCQYCHAGAERSRHAGIPAADVCMNCHRLVTAARSSVRAEEKAAEAEGRPPRRVISPELAKLYDALALSDDLQQRDPQRSPRPIEWVRIHQLPDFAFFDHRPHVAAGIDCRSCHGPIDTLERVRQVESLSMGWCLDCHRDPTRAGLGAGVAAASTDCGVCHY